MKKLNACTLALFLVLATLFFNTLTAHAQDDEQDPPGRVARLNFSSGSVSFQPGGEGDWLTAVQNRPLTTGDRCHRVSRPPH